MAEPCYEELRAALEETKEKLESRERRLRELGVDDWEPKPVPAKEPVAIRLCHHLRVNGKRCRSAATTDRDYCYFHLAERGRRLKMARARARGQRWRLELPPLEDLYAVQVSITQVLEAMADEHLDSRRGALMLYGLQQAATNLRAPEEVWERSCRFDNVEKVEWAGFEEEHGVPEGFDVDTPPEVAFPPRQEPAAVLGTDGEEERKRTSARSKAEADAKQQAVSEAGLLKTAAPSPEAGMGALNRKDARVATDTVAKKSPRGEGERKGRKSKNAS